MGNSTSEYGRVKLPRGEFVRVRRALAERHNKKQQQYLDAAKAIWASATHTQRRSHTLMATLVNEATEDDVAYDEITRILGVYGYNQERPRSPQKQNVGFVPMRTKNVHDGMAGASFDDDTDTVTWWVDSGNHSVDFAQNGWLYGAFRDEMSRVVWQRGTGGMILYRDEYVHSATTTGFGPVGVEKAPERTQPYRTTGGQVTKADIDKAAAKQLRAEARRLRQRAVSLEEQGRTRTGQYDFKRQSLPDIRL